jgi:predicted transposase/invertase (TIGR01784 family)
MIRTRGLSQLFRRHRSSKSISNPEFALATTDTGFKHLLGGDDSQVIISLLNSLVPAFIANPILSVERISTSLPVLKREGEKQLFMDLRVRTQNGTSVLVEMQARRHVCFDERAVFYAASAYAQQLNDKQCSKHTWYTELRPVVAVQILNYDSNRIKGIKNTVDPLVERVNDRRMKKRQYLKNFLLTDSESGQVIEHIQLVQIELPRADAVHKLFPPKPTFTVTEWWLSVLAHAGDYTDSVIAATKEMRMPEVVATGLSRLRLRDWGNNDVIEYQRDLLEAERFSTVLEVEREEGRSEGRSEGLSEGKLHTLAQLINYNRLTEEVASEGLTSDEIDALKAMLKGMK